MKASHVLRLAAVLPVALAIACSEDTVSRARAQISADPTMVDFGSVAPEVMLSRTITLANIGGAELTITRAAIVDDTRSAFTLGAAAPTAIAAGATASVTILYSSGSAGGLDSARFLVESTADNAPALSIPLSGRVLDTNPSTDAGPRLDATEDAGASPVDAGDAGVTADAEPLADASMPGMGTWVTGDFGACSTLCGTGTRTRTVQCQDASGAVLPDASCADPRPLDSEACTEQTGCACSSPSCPGNVCTLATPGEIDFDVPAGCRSILVRMWGGGGAGGSQVGALGGGGAFASARFTASGAVERFAVWVAEGGRDPGDGAGASYFLRGTSPLLIAAGGGGAGSDGCSGCSTGGAGGAGGGAGNGEDGRNLLTPIPPFCTSATAGTGASPTQGGTGGVWSGTAQYRCNGEAGAADTGGSANGGILGNACYLDRASRWQAGGGQGNGGGGGGGAGRFGGGGAGFIWTYCAGGGGGGSSYADVSARDVRLEGGLQSLQGNMAEGGGAGRGGARDTAGANGRVEIVLEP